MRFKVGGRDVATVNDRSVIRTDVDRKTGKAKGETLVEKSESDLSGSLASAASHPFDAAQAAYTGDTQRLLKTKTDLAGATLEDDSYTRLGKLNIHDYRDAAAGFGQDNLDDWMAMRPAIRRAGNDRAAIAKLLQDYKSRGDDRRRRIVERATDLGGGTRFELPDAIKDQKDVFDTLVVQNPLARAAELAAEGRTAESIEEAKSVGARLEALSTAIRPHVGKITSTVLDDMTSRISKRKAEVRAHINKLSTPAPEFRMVDPAAPKPGVLSPEALAEADKAKAERSIADKKAETEAELQSLIRDLQDARANENAKFAEVEALFEKGKVWGVRLSNPSMADILPKLHEVDVGYEKWDQRIERLKTIYRDRNESADQANQYKPNRHKWNELNTRKE